LSLENPDQDAKNKIAKVIPTTMAALVGRWKGDSTYTVDDTHADLIKFEPVWFEVFADTSYSQLDTTRVTFTGKSDGVYYLSGDTLITFPSNAPPDTFMVQLSFVGNYLRLHHLADQRFSFFHKIKPQDSATQIEMLKDSVWRMQGRRLNPGIFRPEPFDRNFSYLRFSGDSMYSDDRLNGVVRTDSGPLVKSGFIWTWKATAGDKGFLADLVKEDSLRMWPLTGGRPDSGYFLYNRTSHIHPWDVDMRPLIGHMRSDSMRYVGGILENHYGRFLDWTFGADHSITIETNIKDVPDFTSWTLDSGFLSVAARGLAPSRFQVNVSGTTVQLVALQSAFFRTGGLDYLTKVDPAKFATKPLERFDKVSYLEMVIGKDTSDYFFNENHIKDQFEIMRLVADSSYWCSITLNKNQETFQSSQSGFYFAFEGRNAALGRYVCRSRPTRDLVIRQTVSTDPLLAQGLLQGACQIIHADSAFADSSLNLEGSFRLRRKTVGSFFSTAWNIP